MKTATELKPAPRIGLALGGGGPLGGIYEIGALRALDEALDGLDFNNIDVYVGVNAGSFVAANLANNFDPPSVDAIVRLFERVSSPADGDDPRRGGCLMVNTLFEIEQPPDAIANEIAQYRDLFRHAFQQSLVADNIADPETRAEFLIGVLWGALSQIRLTKDTGAATPITTIVIENVRSWTPTD